MISRRMKLNSLSALAVAVVFSAAGAARATTTFADFNDTAPNQWVYTNGALTASTATANFLSFGAPNQILNYTGPVTYNLRASATGPATNVGGVISQAMSGEIVFKHGTVTVLDAVFSGALIEGVNNSNSTHLGGDTQIAGNFISFSADPSVQVNQIVEPLSFSIALTQIRGDTEGRAYYERKRAAGKTKREALRCLKRRLSDIVFTTMRHDAAGADAQPDRHSRPTRPLAGAGAVDANEARLTA